MRGSLGKTLPPDQIYPGKTLRMVNSDEERICQSPNCSAVLSRYNHGNLCSPCLEKDKWQVLFKDF